MLFLSAADRDFVVNTYRADEGGRQTLERLARHLDEMEKPANHLVFKRTFHAPRELVFENWTDAERVAQWWEPHDCTNTVRKIDVQPGGRMLIDMRTPDGSIDPINSPMNGTFMEVVEHERLVFITRMNELGGGILFEMINTVHFGGSAEGKTELTLDVRVVRASEGAGVTQGWTQSLERLDILLQSEFGREL